MSVFFAAAVAIVAGGLFYYHSYRTVLLENTEKTLRSITLFKADQLKAWRTDRLERVGSLVDSPILAIYLKRFAANTENSEIAALLRERLEKFIRYNSFRSAVITDGKGKVYLATGVQMPRLCPNALALIKAMRGPSPEMGDIHVNPVGDIHGIHIAIQTARSPSGAPFFLLLSITPDDYLYPLVQKWPWHSPSAETVLLRREGPDVLFLNELRHVKGAALRLKVPFTAALPAAMAARGGKGLLRTTDYRGKKVLACAMFIEELGWMMVNKIDEDEVLAEAARIFHILLLLMLSLLALAAAVTYSVFKAQQAALSKTAAERAIAENSLAKSEKSLKEAQRLARLGNWALDLVSGELSWSDEVFRIFEIVPGGFGATYKAFLDAIHPEDREAVDKAYTESVKNKSAYEITHRLLMKDGRIKYVSECGETIYDPQGRPLRSFGTIQDVTGLKLAELQAERLNLELVNKNQEMENFLYITTHDLRSPLVNVQGFSQNLQRYLEELKDELERITRPGGVEGALKTLTEEKIPSALNFILDSSVKMDALITALLKVSRAGRVEMKPETVEMNGLIKEILNVMRFQLQEAGAEVETDPLPHCLADPGAVNQIFSNLLGNAVKHRSPERPPRITVKGRIHAGRVLYTVSDNGPGIPEGDLPRVWDIFFRPGSAGAGGEGIGLPLAKRLAEKNGGSIRAQSTPGEGMAFIVELPGMNSPPRA